MKKNIYLFFLSLFTFLSVHTQAQIITTIAGSGASGVSIGTFNMSGNGGPATTATLGEPWGVAADGLGNIYFSDHYSNRILKIDPAGIITSFAGIGVSGYTGDGGPATAAEITGPFGLAADASGSVYIAGWSGNTKIRKINTSGVITTIAGGGSALGDGGPATAANLSNAYGVAVDGTGNIYIADGDHNRIREVNISGIISTIAGNGIAGFSGDGGPATAAELNYPYGVAVDGAGNIYIADLGNQRIRKINTSGIITTIAGNGGSGYSGDGGAATAATVPDSWGVAADAAGNVYIPDHTYHHIRQINASGIITNFAGTGTSGFTGDGGIATAAKISEPIGVGVDSYGNVYIPDLHNARIRKVTVHNRPPVFTGGHSQDLTVCENSVGDPVNAQLAVFDSDAYQREIWSLVTPPAHGTATVADTLISANDTLHTTGLYYTPAAGYMGNDSFKVQVTDGMASDTTTIYISFNPAPAVITGAAAVCPGAAITLSDATTGGAWSSSAMAIATAGSASGIITGAGGGTATISYTLLSNGCAATTTVTVNTGPATITGTASACAGAATILTDATTGGIWSSGNTAVATVGSAGTVGGVSSGTATITYTIAGGCNPATTVVTVHPMPAPISGVSICSGATATLTDAITGGTWSSSNTTIATIGSASGAVTGGVVPAAAAAVITYTAPGGCPATTTVTVNPQPAAIGGLMGICAGAATALTDGTGGGMWASSNTAVATIGTSGTVTGVAGGTASVIYTLSAGCAASATVSITPAPPAITGATSICAGAAATLSDAATGGSWSSNNTTLASIDPLSGAVTTSFSFGAATISYTLFSTGCAATTVVTVSIGPLPISGTLSLCGTGATATLSDVIGGGTWSGGNTAVATVDGAGTLYGVAAGTTAISYTYNTCTVTATATVSPAPFLIIGPPTVCLGLTAPLNDLTTGGVWSSSNTAVATVSPAGTFYTVSTGTATVAYTLPGGCATTKAITVGTAPTPITGAMRVCAGSVAALTDAGGGTWSSGSSGIATIGSASGMVDGITTGTTVITYSLGAGCSVTTVVTVNPIPSAITGAFTVCPGSATALTDGGGGTWASSNTVIATVNGIGAVGGVAAGTSIIIYTLPTGCTTLQTVTVSPLPAAIGGPLSVCAGSTITLTETSSGGAWSSSATTAATIGSAGGVAGLLPGTATVTYTLSTGCRRTAAVTVNPLPAAITGTLTMCAGAATILSDATSGGTWSPASGAAATVNATGAVAGITAGTAAISYTINTGCTRTATVTVNALPPAISGPTAVCAGAVMTATDSPPGGAWSSTATAVATIGSTGIVTGVATGTTTITYTSPAGCTAAETVTVSLSPGPISGAAAVCANDTVYLSDIAGGGLWSSGNTAAAAIGSLTGIVSGIAAGTTTVTYSLGSGCTVTRIETVNAAPAAITGTMALCAGAATTLSDATTGGAWSSGNTAVAQATGTGVTGMSAGTATVAYTLAATGCAAATVVTVSISPLAVTGTPQVCPGATAALSDAISGGVWTSGNTAIANAGPAGTVTGITSGTAIITYSIGSCTVSQAITVNPISAISGAGGMCVGITAHLSDAVTGGTWGSSAAAIATVNAAGTVTALSSGTATVTYTAPTGCMATAMVVVSTAPSAISGAQHVCAGDTITLGNTAGGGAWASSNTGIATVGTTTGTVTGIAPGTAVITYSLGSGCTTAAIVTVSAAPPAISGTATMCAGATTTLTDGTGGAWSSGNTAVATITASGAVTGAAAGTAMITYTAGSGCMAMKEVTINPQPSGITGTTHVCAGQTTILADAATGGTWSSGSPGTSTAGSLTGIITGLLPGPSTITYTLPGGCHTAVTVVVNAAPPPISGMAVMCIGSSSALTGATGGGAWASGNTAVAAVGSTGVVSGLAAGTATISYTSSVSGCPATVVATVNTAPPAITGIAVVCAGSSTVLTDLPGGAWSTSNTAIANVDAITGTVTGIAPGVAAISYSSGVGCSAGTMVTVNALPPPITGDPTICAGYTTTLSDPSGGGLWSSNNTAVATVAAGGVVHGLTGGAAIISYTSGAGGCAATRIVTVTLVPAISGLSSLCAYSAALPVYDSLPGGAWTSTLATISSSGVITPFSAGVAMVTYTLPTGCFTTAALTVNPLPAVITGTNHFCMGLTMAFNDTTAGGIWSSGNTVIAGISTSGMVTGLSAGTATISYAMAGGCAQTILVTIDSLPAAGTITGLPAVCSGATITLTDAAAGGTWSSTNTSAGVSAGMVSGITEGTDTIRYIVANTCGTAATARTITVNPLPVAGTIAGAGSLCAGDHLVLTDAATGGAWSSSSALATVSGGSVGGVSGGTDTISYSVTNVCGTATALKTVTINALPSPGTISGQDTLCIGASFMLADTAAGGLWTASNDVISITAGALISAVSAGTDTISYSITNMCGTASASFAVVVKDVPGGVAITGPATVCAGAKDTLTGMPAGGTWYSSNANAVIIGGLLSGISAGADTIVYTIVSTCGPAVALYPVMVVSGGACNTGVSPAPVMQATELLRVWPNPNEGAFMVMLSSPADEAVQLIITNIVGEKIKETTTITNQATAIKLNAGTGVYFITAISATGNYVAKVAVE